MIAYNVYDPYNQSKYLKKQCPKQESKPNAGLYKKVSGIPNGEAALDISTKLVFVGISAFLVLLAGLVSGLTIGLLSLDKLQMEVLQRSGTETERRLATKIKPLISNTHFLLVTLLITNASCMEALPIFLDRLVDPVGAVIISVTLVLIFGEILPQAICSKYGLQVGAYTSWIVRILMVVTGIISWPVGKLLDYLFGEEELGQYRRPNLEALISLQQRIEGLGGELTDFEAQVMKGALRLSTKVASKAMTPLKYTFMLSSEDPIDDTTLQRVLGQGHSRIPVYNGSNKTDIVGLIIVKELIRIRPDCKKVGDLNLRPIPRLPYNFPMYDILRLFSTGRSHIALLIRAKRGTTQFEGNEMDNIEPEHLVILEEQKADTDLLHFWQTYMEESTFENDTNGRYSHSQERTNHSPRSNSNQSNPSSHEERDKFHFSLNPFSSASQGHLENSKKKQEVQNKKKIETKAHDDSRWRQYLGEDTEPVGIITIEDVIEELLGEEIVDETDQFQDNLKQNKVDVQKITSRLPQNLQYMLKYSQSLPYKRAMNLSGGKEQNIANISNNFQNEFSELQIKKRSHSVVGVAQPQKLYPDIKRQAMHSEQAANDIPRVNTSQPTTPTLRMDADDSGQDTPKTDTGTTKVSKLTDRAGSAVVRLSLKNIIGISSNKQHNSEENQPLIRRNSADLHSQV